MRISHLDGIGSHYATTLEHWHWRFVANIENIRRLDYPEWFIHTWEYRPG